MTAPREGGREQVEVVVSLRDLTKTAANVRHTRPTNASRDLAVTSTILSSPAAVQAVSVPLESTKIAVKSFRFTPREEKPNVATPPARPSQRPRTAKRTRIRAPRDVVRLEDRLSYVLQPPLETLLADEMVELPFAPFDYQLDGIAFLFPRHHAVLADEMGLGKTMQAVTTTRLLIRSQQVRQVLLVCPKPLVTNWQREFSLWAPEIPVTAISGPSARREFLWRQRAVVSLVNYETLVRDESIVEALDLEFDLVVLDESQRIKTRGGATNRVVRNLVRQRSWALTGTPIENSTDDLVAIFDFVAPGNLRPGMKPREMGRAVADVVLRRTKDIVMQDMPPKLVRDAEIDLTPEQWESYQRAETDGVVQLGDLGESITLQHVFQLVLRLKQICNFDPVTGESSKLRPASGRTGRVSRPAAARRLCSANGSTRSKNCRCRSRRSVRCSTTARCPTGVATGCSPSSATIPTAA